MIWVSFVMEGNKQDGKREVELQSAQKWVKTKRRPPNKSPW